MRHYQLHVVILTLAVLAAFEAPISLIDGAVSSSSSSRSYDDSVNVTYRFLEIKLSNVINGSQRPLRNARNLIQVVRLQIGKDVRLTDNCKTPENCNVEMPSLPRMCSKNHKSKLLQEYCPLGRSREPEYGQFFTRIKSIYGLKAAKYLCMRESGTVFSSSALTSSCLFIFWMLRDCKCRQNETDKECFEKETSLSSDMGFIIFSASRPSWTMPNRNHTHGVQCNIARPKANMDWTLIMNDEPRWFLSVHNDRLRRGNETDPLDPSSRWQVGFSLIESPALVAHPLPKNTTTTTTTRLPTTVVTKTSTSAPATSRRSKKTRKTGRLTTAKWSNGLIPVFNLPSVVNNTNGNINELLLSPLPPLHLNNTDFRLRMKSASDGRKRSQTKQ